MRPAPRPTRAPLTSEQWVTKLKTNSKAILAAGGPHIDAGAARLAATQVAAVFAKQPENAAKLAGRGIDGGFFDALAQLAAESKTAAAPLPPDLRRHETLTPADATAIDEAVEAFRDFRGASVDTARATASIEQTTVLGHGVDFRLSSAAATSTAIQHFLAGAPERKALLDDAGITGDDLKELATHKQKMDDILGAKGLRASDFTTNVGSVDELTAALESGFDYYRGRVRLAFRGKDKPLRAKALKPLPGSTERRGTKAKPKPKPKPAPPSPPPAPPVQEAEAKPSSAPTNPPPRESESKQESAPQTEPAQKKPTPTPKKRKRRTPKGA